MARDVIDLIERDHRSIQQLFAALRGGDGDRELLFQQLAVLLLAHSRAEEAEVYPAVAALTADGEVTHARQEHAEADDLLARLRTMSPESEPFGPLLEQLMTEVDHHIEEEESGPLELLRAQAGAARRSQLAEAFLARRGRELAHGPSTRQVGGSELSRDRLYDKAREHNIIGRSQMSKEELLAAVKSAESDGE